MTEYVDSLNSMPEGKAKLNEMTSNAFLGGNWTTYRVPTAHTMSLNRLTNAPVMTTPP